MSRVGKKPISIPEKTKVTYKDRIITVEGAKGKLQHSIHPSVDLKIDDKEINVELSDDKRETRAFQGLTRALVANMVQGVSAGFERNLEINGIGYRADVKGNKITLNLGYSHPIDFDLPDGITASVDRNVIKLMGIDKQALGQTAASIRELRPPEPYKGKGIKYADEFIQKKAGKTGTK